MIKNEHDFVEARDFTTTTENTIINDNPLLSESETIKENAEYNEMEYDSVHPVDSKKKKNQTLSLMSGSLVTVVASAVVGMTTLLNVNMSAEFDNVSYSDGTIHYEVSVVDMDEDDTLTAYVYEGDYLKATIELVDDDKDGKIIGDYQLNNQEIKERLDSGTDVSIKYNFTLKGVVGLNVERKFDNYAIKIDKVTSKFEDVDYWCNCGVDGYYYFQMNFEDDLGLFKNFEAEIVDTSGNKSVCTFNDDLHSAQKIYVLNLVGTTGTLTITYEADGVKQTITQSVNF